MSDEVRESRNWRLCLGEMIEFSEAVFYCWRNCVTFEARRVEW